MALERLSVLGVLRLARVGHALLHHRMVARTVLHLRHVLIHHHHDRVVIIGRLVVLHLLLIKLGFELQVGLEQRLDLLLHIQLILCFFLLHEGQLSLLLFKL